MVKDAELLVEEVDQKGFWQCAEDFKSDSITGPARETPGARSSGRFDSEEGAKIPWVTAKSRSPCGIAVPCVHRKYGTRSDCRRARTEIWSICDFVAD
jgi:hypothetical protein